MGAVYTSNTYAVKTQTFNTDTLLINPENNTDERINILDYFTDNNIKLSKDTGNENKTSKPSKK